MMAFLRSPGDKKTPTGFVFPLFPIRLPIRLRGMNEAFEEVEVAKFSCGLHSPNLMSVK